MAGEDGLIYAISAGKLYSVDVAGRKVKLIINWNDVCGELTADTLKYIIGCDGQAITAVCYYRGSYVLLKLEWTDKTDERKVITLLTANEYGWLAQRAGEFNGMNNEYRIVVKKISEGDDTEEDRQTKIRLMLSSGECPDIIDIGCIVGWEELADKGIFEDLNPYMENSSIVDVNDYLPQLLEGGRLGNRQIFIPYDFLLLMLYGKEENIGNNQIWTLEEMLGLYELHEDMSILNCEPRNCLKYLMTISLDEFVDFDSMVRVSKHAILRCECILCYIYAWQFRCTKLRCSRNSEKYYHRSPPKQSRHPCLRCFFSSIHAGNGYVA